MDSTDPRLGRIVLLGKDFGNYGVVASTLVGTEAAAAISVGADDNSPSKRFKDDIRVDNEDAMCLIAAPDWIGMAVADAHYGPESSHMLIERLHKIWAKIRPSDPTHMAEMVEFLRQGDPARTESETTLLLVSYDRHSRQGFGLNFGDSTFAIAGPDRPHRRINPQDHRFVATNQSGSLRHGTEFFFSAIPGDLLMIYTDGINECHYRNPQTSMQDHHIHEAVQSADFEPLRAVNQVAQMALAGVDGYPGGQDNIVLGAARA